MSGEIWRGGTWCALTRGEMYRAGAWRRLTRGEVYKAGQWRQFVTFVPDLSATASSDAFGTTSGRFGQTVSSNYVTITPVGGLGPFTYSWSVGSGIAITNANGATTAFSKFLTPFQETIADATCTITDSLGSTANVTVSVDLVHEGS